MLESLPLELVHLILSYFRSRELARMATTCRRVNAVVYDIFVRTLAQYGVTDLGGRGYSNYRESIEFERVQVQSTFPFIDRMRELQTLLEMFEQQVESLVPLPTRFVPRAMVESGEGIARWSPNSQLLWVLQERIGSKCPELKIGVTVENPRDIAALVDCGTMVQCLLILIRDLQRGNLLQGFDHDTRRPTAP